jgi:hypothetical protein
MIHPQRHPGSSSRPAPAVRPVRDEIEHRVRGLLDDLRGSGRLSHMGGRVQPYARGAELAYYPTELRTRIMEAGPTKTLLRLTYDGVERLVEPYETPATGSARLRGTAIYRLNALRLSSGPPTWLAGLPALATPPSPHPKARAGRSIRMRFVRRT